MSLGSPELNDIMCIKCLFIKIYDIVKEVLIVDDGNGDYIKWEGRNSQGKLKVFLKGFLG